MKFAQSTMLSPEKSAEALVKTIKIPPCPALLIEVQQELSCKDPDPKRLSRIVANDVALSAALLKVANSSFFGLRLRATSVEHVIDLLGMQHCSLLLMGVIARQTIPAENPELENFWDVSGKRAQAMCYLAKQTQLCPLEFAHVFGLFADIGIPLMMDRFPGYGVILKEASLDSSNCFTSIEDRQYQVNHATVGALLGRTWGLPTTICDSILLHHDYETLTGEGTEESVKALMALSLLAEAAIQGYRGNSSVEWIKGGKIASHYLVLSRHEISDHLDNMYQIFDQSEF